MAPRLPQRKAPPRRSATAVPPLEAAPAAGRAAEVVLDVDVDESRVHLVLANCGDAVATDVQVEFSRPLTGLGGSFDLSAIPLFKRLGVLRPGRALRIFWDAAPALLSGDDRAAAFVATVSWTERARPRQRAQYHHDLSIFRHVPISVDPDRR
jgi:hypothetical protein